MVPIARRNLLADKVKLLVAVGGVTLAILLMIVINSLYQGVRRDAVDFIQSLPGDAWVMQLGTTDLVFSNSSLASADATKIQRVPGVDNVTVLNGRLMTFNANGKQARTYVMALDYLGRGPTGVGSQYVPTAGHIIIDKTFAKSLSLSVGDYLPIGTTVFQVSEIREIANLLVTQIAFVSAADYAASFGTPGSVNYYLVSYKPGYPTEQMQQNIAAVVKDSQVVPTSVFANGASERSTSDFLPIIRVILSISFIVGLAVLSLVIYTATIERAREYAIMKVIGASPLSLYRIVLSQSTFIAIVGFAFGVGLSFVFNMIAGDFVPQFVTYIRPIDIAYVLGATAVMTFVASVLPLNRIARVEPAAVFRA